MATVTLTANTDVSALSLANDDTIDLAGFVLTFDVQPTVTGIQVTTPGTDGRCVFPVACVIPTWDFFGGSNTTAGMIGTLPATCEIGSITGGELTSSHGVNTNAGIVGTANGGTGGNTMGVLTNNGHVETCNGREATSARGVFTNNGTVGTANGGTGGNTHGVSDNNGTVGRAKAGSGGASHGVNQNFRLVAEAEGSDLDNAKGVNSNFGTVVLARGGLINTGSGIQNNHGLCFRLEDSTGPGVFIWNGVTCFVEGPFINGIIPTNIKTIYSLGPLSENATIAGDATVITLSEGTGTAGFTGIRAISRRLGT
jgi:hypothetical protein